MKPKTWERVGYYLGKFANHIERQSVIRHAALDKGFDRADAEEKLRRSSTYGKSTESI